MRDRYAERYQHVLIDEFQDTNLVQYALARELASRHRNIAAVGDPDQSIYSWRAADIRNLQHFERDFPGAEVVLLEQNYRSTGPHPARRARGHREGRRAPAKRAVDRERRRRAGGRVRGSCTTATKRRCSSALGGAAGCCGCRSIAHHADFAVMYRTNAQSRAIEEACIQHGIRYRLVGGTRFYDRREVRDLLAYLRLVHNHSDGVAFQRVVNVPARGIGAKTLSTALWRRRGARCPSRLSRIARGSAIRGDR